MDKNAPRIAHFERTISQLTKLVVSFPPEKRESVFFDKWSLKDVLSHLNNWMIHDIECLNSLSKGKEPHWEPDIDTFNNKGVQERQFNSWGEVYREFEELNKDLIKLYKSLEDKYWDMKIWKSRQHTPASFLLEDINHWNEHMKQIKLGS